MAIKKRRKSKKSQSQGPTFKLLIDRFFEDCRNEHNIYAFQNESKKKLEFLDQIKLPYVVTLLPKRSYFVTGSDNLLVENGFCMEFSNLTKEQYLLLRKLLFYYFKNSFQLYFPINDVRNKLDNTLLSGKFTLKNLKTKEELLND